MTKQEVSALWPLMSINGHLVCKVCNRVFPDIGDGYDRSTHYCLEPYYKAQETLQNECLHNGGLMSRGTHADVDFCKLCDVQMTVMMLLERKRERNEKET